MDGRRLSIDAMSHNGQTHVGLWLDRYCPFLGKLTDNETVQIRDSFFGQVEKANPVSEVYQRAFLRWRMDVMAGEYAGAVVRAESRLAIGLGSSSVMETGLSLHHTYGVPFLPGSALKGVARNFMLKNATDMQFRPSSETRSDVPTTFDILFGYQGRAGCVTFHDGWLLPNEQPTSGVFVRDVITVHHAKYYSGTHGTPPTGGGNEILPPGDWDNPNPVSYINIKPDTSFLLLISGPTQWSKFAIEIVLRALHENGIGAKTTSGYGRLVAGEGEDQTWRRLAREFSRMQYENEWNDFNANEENIDRRVRKIFDVGNIRRKSMLATAIILSDDGVVITWRNNNPYDSVKLRVLSLDYVSQHGFKAGYREALIKAAFELVDSAQREEVAGSLAGKISIAELIEVADHIGHQARKRRAWEFICNLYPTSELLSAIASRDIGNNQIEKTELIIKRNTLSEVIQATLCMSNREEARFIAKIVREKYDDETLLAWGIEHQEDYDRFAMLNDDE